MTVCVRPTGQTTERVAPWLADGSDTNKVTCTGLARAEGDPCPPSDAFASCHIGACDFPEYLPTDEPERQEADCCYPTVACLGASGCGRPLFANSGPLVSSLATTDAWC